METTPDNNYFSDRQESYLKSLAPLFSSAAKVLSGQIPKKLITAVIQETKDKFPPLLLELPYLGGDWNLFNASIVSGVAALAYIRVLEKHGIPTGIIHKSVYDIYSRAYSSLPGIVKFILRQGEFGRKHIRQLREYAERTLKREYPGNYVVSFIPGYGNDFDFGFDCEECALVKYYDRMDAGHHLPYICIGDFASSRALRTGLRRTTTLSYGGPCCDFRYKRNTLGLVGYPPENLPEYHRR